MKSSSSLPWKTIGLVLVLVGAFVLPASFSDLAVGRVEARIDGASRLISVNTMEDATCALPQPAPRATAKEAIPIPINPVTIALALQQAQPGTSARVPAEAQKAAVAARRPLRTIHDEYPAFSAVAVDAERNEVVLQDENLFQTMVFNRTTNTPPNARMSEPKRAIRGPGTYLELNCAVYIDPKTGNIYSLNNDTEQHMTVFDREARGNASPVWKLRTPMGAFGLAVDEETEELLITAQLTGSVSWFPKTARDDAPPTGLLQGDRTLLADPHGIALDTKQNVIFVANFGAVATERPHPPGDSRPPLWPFYREMVPGSGRFLPVSITVYDKKARGDVPPLRVITGPNTQLNWPVGLFVDSPRGELYVANDGGDSILVFRTDARGDAAPIRVLKGPRTKLRYPSSVFVDVKNDELWVASFGNHLATVYRRTAAGDTAPIRQIRSAPDGTPAPTLANTRVGYDTKREQILAPN
jgi:DNA-binding beta-propeller fold protein YncE